MKTAAKKKPTNHQAAFITVQIPPIGAEWPGEGGIYAGIGRGADGQLAHVIVGPEAPERLDWKSAQKWAAGLEIDGHANFMLPTRRDQSLCFANIPEQFKEAWYWSGAQHASYASYAWFQDFSNGFQYGLHKDYELRARAVRRLVIQ